MEHMESERSKQSRLAVLFPGIGYRFDRPLLYYAEKQAASFGYEILHADYTGFPEGIRGNQKNMQEAYRIAMAQTEAQFAGIEWETYTDILFISKSIGTVAAVHFACRKQIRASHILFTPFPETFVPGMQGKGIAFHARTDPWMEDEETIQCARKAGVRMICYPSGDHSLESGDVIRDLFRMKEIFSETEYFIKSL